jgi:RNA polymerase sigma factor (sigma-70 family)
MTAAGLATLVRHIRSAAEESDEQLLHAFAARRDPSAFAALVRRHGPGVLGVCRRVLGQEQDAEDAFQATFLVLARKPGAVRRGDALASFLHGVSYRIAMRAKRDSARRRKHEARTRVPTPTPPGGEVAWREVQGVLDEEVEALPAIYRSAFVLCCLEGHSQADAARRLGVKEGTVSSRLTHARKLLRAALARRGITLSAVLSALALSGGARAALPRALAEATVRVGVSFAAGAAGGLPARVVFLAEGALRTLVAPKMKLATALVLTFALLGASAAALWQRHASAGEPAPAAKEAAGKGPAAPRPKPAKGEETTVSGRVLDPEGKPATGAKVYVSTYSYKDRIDPPVRATTDSEGRFSFTARKEEVGRNDMVVAVARGYGPDWLGLGKLKPGAEATLRLVKDVPITGRVLDLEGKPVAGVTVRVIHVRKAPGEDLSALVKGLQARPKDRDAVNDVWYKHWQRMEMVWGVLGAPKSVTTGKDGRFRLAGFGRERVVTLLVEGPTIAHEDLYVLTRPGLKGLPPHTHGPAFDHLAAPTKPIRGTVKDRRTGKPVAGIGVGGQPQLDDRIGAGASTKTDTKGRFTLLGVPKAKAYHLNVGGAPYVATGKEVADTPGLEPIEVDFEVERALALRVRVVDKVTGRPVRAYVQYAIRGGNPSLESYTTFRRFGVSWTPTDRDGWAEETVLPGPGLVAVQAMDGEFTRSRLKDKHAGDRFVGNLVPTNLWFDFYHAIVPINPDEKDRKSLTLTVALDRGRSVRGRVVGPDGKPLAGVLVAGRTAVRKVGERDSERLTGPDFTAVGLDGRQPRMLVFLHEEKRLARAVMVRGDERGPLTVRLAPLGTLTGRLVDAKGRPVAGARVFAMYSDRIASTVPVGLVMAGLGNLRDTVGVLEAKTDRGGRFRLRGLVPGLKYDLGRSEPDGGVAGWLKRDLSPVPGKALDVGDVRAGKLPRK